MARDIVDELVWVRWSLNDSGGEKRRRWRRNAILQLFIILLVAHKTNDQQKNNKYVYIYIQRGGI